MSTIQFRRGTAAAWTAANPVLAAGEPAYETDTGQQKVGDGVTAYADLPYEPGGTGTYASAQAGTTIGTSSMVDGEVVLSFESVWGINTDGDAYYDPDGAAPGEGAVLMLNPVDGSLVIIQPEGATTP